MLSGTELLDPRPDERLCAFVPQRLFVGAREDGAAGVSDDGIDDVAERVDVADVADVVEVAEVAAAGALARAARSLAAGGPHHAVVLDPHPVPIATSATIESISG